MYMRAKVCVSMSTYMEARGHNWASSFMRDRLSLNLELALWDRMTGQQSTGTYLSQSVPNI